MGPRPVKLRDETDQITDLVNKIWNQYDTDRSGFLDKQETLNLLDDVVSAQGKKQTSMEEFVRFFDEFDVNGDGVISKRECAVFIKQLLA